MLIIAFLGLFEIYSVEIARNAKEAVGHVRMRMQCYDTFRQLRNNCNVLDNAYLFY